MGQFVLDVTNSPDSEHVMLEVAKYLKQNVFPFKSIIAGKNV